MAIRRFDTNPIIRPDMDDRMGGKVNGPWTMHTPGVLDLADSHFLSHVASPDVIVLEQGHDIRMYYHGCGLPAGQIGRPSSHARHPAPTCV